MIATTPAEAERQRKVGELRELLADLHRRLGLDRPRKDFSRGRLRANHRPTPKVRALDRAYRQRVEAER